MVMGIGFQPQMKHKELESEKEYTNDRDTCAWTQKGHIHTQLYTPLLVGAVGPSPRLNGPLVCLIYVMLREALHAIDPGDVPLAPAARCVEEI